MGFRAVKAKLLAALRAGDVIIASRSAIETKNLLATGALTTDELIEIVSACRGHDYEARPHHQISEVTIHILRQRGWYVKFYFVDPHVVIVSVHR
jgi:hypothetical protein